MPLKLNYKYYQCIFYKENIDPNSKSKVVDELTKKLKNLIAVYRVYLQHTQEMQKQAHDKETKLKSYARSEKV